MDAAHDNRRQLGRLMVEEGFLAEEQLAHALAEQARTGRPLGTILVELGFVSAGAVSNALAEQHGGLLKTEFGISAGLHVVPGGTPSEPKAPAQPDPVAARVHELESQVHAVLTERNALAQTVNELQTRLSQAAPPHEAEVARVTAAAAARIAELEAEVQTSSSKARAEEAEVARITAAAIAKVTELEAALKAGQTVRNELESARQIDATRISELQQELATLREEQRRQADIPMESPTEHAHLLFVHSSNGYTLVEAPGPAPASGTRLDVDGVGFVVLRVGASPLPGSRLRCVFLARL